MQDRQYNANDYTVGWVCALPLEMAGAKAMLDEIHPNLSEQAPTDHNSYLFGRVQGHNVVIACLPAGVYGTTPAAAVAKDMLRTFKSIRFGLMIGIGGGAPSSRHDIRLGDVVVSQPSGTTGGVIQYDRGKDGRDGVFERTGSLNAPPQVLLTALGRLQADHYTGDSRVPEFLAEGFQRYPKMKKAFSSRGESNDCLFEAEYEHASNDTACDQCDRARSVQRDPRDDADPVVHYGNIASGNLVIKNAQTRDQLSRDLGVLCFEMEAAGLMQDFPSLVIRGICDYADTHKNKEWQGYAAAVAAAFAKELLSVIPPERVLQEKAIPQLVSDPVLQHLMSATKKAISKHTIKQEIRYENDRHVACHQVLKTSRYEDFKNINPDRVPGTCKWVLGHPQYQKWRGSSHDDLLWISADPGCGKSVLVKALIDEELDNAGDHTVCYFFFKDNDEQDSLSTAHSAVLHQLFGRLPHLLQHAISAFEENGQKLQSEVDELWRIFLAAATDESANAVTCVLDALDECQGEDCRKLVRLLTDFYCRCPSASRGSSQLKFLVTSRPYQDIEIGFDHIPSELPSIRLAGEESNADISEEINLVIRQRIARAGIKLHPDQDVRDTLQAKLLATQNRTYLWLHLMWDELERSRKRTKKAFLKKIDSLPSTVEDAYEKILARNGRVDQEEAKVLLHIVIGARRPLTVREMDVAFQLAVESPNALQHQDLDLDGDQLKTRIRELCGLFVFINDNRIYLIHQTAKEFLITKDALDVSVHRSWKRSISMRQPNKIMAEVCIQYLLFQDIQDEELKREDTDIFFYDYPLLEYSSVNWPAHYRDMGEADEDLFGRLYNLYDTETIRFETWVSIFWDATYVYRERKGQGVLHLAALNGHDQVISRLLRGGQINVDFQDGQGVTPLQCAALGGHSETVKLLLERGASPSLKDKDGLMPIHLAAQNGHVEVIQLLLEDQASIRAFKNDTCSHTSQKEQEVVANAPDTSFRTPLHHSVLHEQAGCVKILLEYGAKLMGDINNMTPLHYTVSRTSEAMALCLVAAGVPIDIRVKRRTWQQEFQGEKLQYTLSNDDVHDLTSESGSEGLTALHYAALIGCRRMTRFLLDHGADSNAVSEHGETPLHMALKRDMNGLPCPNFIDHWSDHIHRIEGILETIGYGPQDFTQYSDLEETIEENRLDVVGLLLDHASTNVSLKDIHGASTLHNVFYDSSTASQIVSRLIKKGADVSARNQHGHTPLHLACFKGNEQSVVTILNYDADITISDTEGLNALHYAALRGDKDIIEHLLARANESSLSGFITLRDKRGRNALHHLLKNPGVVDCAVVQYLIDNGINVNDLDEIGMSPLSLYLDEDFMLLHDAPPVVRLILQRGSDPSFRTREGGLGLAHLHANSCRINLEILRALAAGGVDLKAEDGEGRTVLHYCAISGSLTAEAFQFLCDESGLAKESVDDYGKSPQKYAAEMRKKERNPHAFDPDRWSRTEDILLGLG